MHETQPVTAPLFAPSETIIRLSPIVFIGRLITIEAIFVLLAILTSIFWDYQSFFSKIPNIETFSLGLVSSLLFAVVQVAVIGLSFLSWYLEVYTLKSTVITHRGGNSIGEREITSYSDIKSVQYTQNRLQSLYNYGTLKLTRAGKLKPVYIKNIGNPSYFARLIRQKMPATSSNGELKPQPIAKLLKQKEDKQLEFKSSLLWDYQRGEINKELKKAVMKNVAAFLNTAGGILVIGVDDNRKVIGLEKDILAVPKKTLDSFENVLNSTFSSMIGIEYRQYVDVEFQRYKNKDVCCLTVYPSNEPVFVTWNGDEEFYIRAGNSSQPLSIKKALQYIQNNWKD